MYEPTQALSEVIQRVYDRRFNLDEPFMLQHLYEIVLLEAISQDELRTWLDASSLHRLWPRLYLRTVFVATGNSATRA